MRGRGLPGCACMRVAACGCVRPCVPAPCPSLAKAGQLKEGPALSPDRRWRGPAGHEDRPTTVSAALLPCCLSGCLPSPAVHAPPPTPALCLLSASPSSQNLCSPWRLSLHRAPSCLAQSHPGTSWALGDPGSAPVGRGCGALRLLLDGIQGWGPEGRFELCWVWKRSVSDSSRRAWAPVGWGGTPAPNGLGCGEDPALGVRGLPHSQRNERPRQLQGLRCPTPGSLGRALPMS